LKQNFTKEFNKYTPLMLAACADDSNIDTVKFLLKKGSDYKVKDDLGNSILHIAAIYGNN
jgi:ankyrin repeat protein